MVLGRQLSLVLGQGSDKEDGVAAITAPGMQPGYPRLSRSSKISDCSRVIRSAHTYDERLAFGSRLCY
jgi:hypothetical protein